MTQITLNHHKELFSEAWVRAVAAAVGYRASRLDGPDDDSVDLMVHARGPAGTIRSPRLEMQLKCTAGDVPTNDFSYNLPVKNYDDLRATNLSVARILVVVIVPSDTVDWFTHSSAELVIRRCGYWRDLFNEPATSNTTSVSVTMPVAQTLSPSALVSLMQPRAQGGVL